jgi:hypothetical protein
MYSWCRSRNYFRLWAYLWVNWYQPNQWAKNLLTAKVKDGWRRKLIHGSSQRQKASLELVKSPMKLMKNEIRNARKILFGCRGKSMWLCWGHTFGLSFPSTELLWSSTAADCTWERKGSELG